jgi:hypothetical protein
MRRLGIAFVGLLALAAAGFLTVREAGLGLFGSHEQPGTPHPKPRSVAPPVARGAKQILFGDLHVHTTFSDDAFSFSLPTLGGEGAHPPADACDFARFCSALDFWSITDHAERLTPQHWTEIVSSIRQCNDVIADPANPDTVAFLGWEWTQIGDTPENHYGHKNVVLAHTDDAHIPTRPIGAERPASRQLIAAPVTARGIAALSEGGRFHDFARYQAEVEATAICPKGVAERDLPADCIELAATPAELFEKLDDWGYDSIVIPHGTTWGMYTPPGSKWDKQLVGTQHDEQRQTLIEVFSGHGDSEVYRDWKEIDWDADGKAVCPPPRPDYLPSCWRAGEIILERCLGVGESEDECAKRAVEARANFVAASLSGHLTVPGATAEDWLDAGQCRDCRTPAFNYRPRSSMQYILALGNFADPAHPRHFRLGVIAASDNHFARPGTGYKPIRVGHSEAMNGAARPLGEGIVGRTMAPPALASQPRSVPFNPEGLSGFQLFETERQQSYLTTGGLTAVHADGRDREAIWAALQRREVYGTSGHRIQLWFDLVNPPGAAPGSVAPMGSEVSLAEAPTFRVRALGSFEQKPGCPDESVDALGPEEVARLCRGECHNPSDTRRAITHIEVVRIRPQQVKDEPVAPLIQDPWQNISCAPSAEGCVATVSDPDFVAGGRETLYYARAFESPALTVNAGGVRCEHGVQGNRDESINLSAEGLVCTRVKLCAREDASEDCLAPEEPRAWSSPIWVTPAPAETVLASGVSGAAGADQRIRSVAAMAREESR